LPPAAAEKKTESDWARLFPAGKVPPGNELYAIEDDASGGRVGDLWFAERANDAGETTLYVYSRSPRSTAAGASAVRRCSSSRTRPAGEACFEANLTVLGGNDVAPLALPLAGLRGAGGLHVEASSEFLAQRAVSAGSPRPSLG
jgi:hypothetical protein